MRYLRENWFWILLPIMVAVVVTLIALASGGDEGSSSMLYPM